MQLLVIGTFQSKGMKNEIASAEIDVAIDNLETGH